MREPTARSGLNFGARALASTPVVIDGRTYCRVCDEAGQRRPNRPGHPLSPYCAEHYRQRRTQAQRKWRAEQRAGKSLRETLPKDSIAAWADGGLVLGSTVTLRLVRDLERAADSSDEAATTILNATAGMSGHGMVDKALRQLKADVTHTAQQWAHLLAQKVSRED